MLMMHQVPNLHNPFSQNEKKTVINHDYWLSPSYIVNVGENDEGPLGQNGSYLELWLVTWILFQATVDIDEWLKQM